jgi:hypothetical protein
MSATSTFFSIKPVLQGNISHPGNWTTKAHIDGLSTACE